MNKQGYKCTDKRVKAVKAHCPMASNNIYDGNLDGHYNCHKYFTFKHTITGEEVELPLNPLKQNNNNKCIFYERTIYKTKKFLGLFEYKSDEPLKIYTRKDEKCYCNKCDYYYYDEYIYCD